jgi:hypothetical protein
MLAAAEIMFFLSNNTQPEDTTIDLRLNFMPFYDRMDVSPMDMNLALAETISRTLQKLSTIKVDVLYDRIPKSSDL